MDSLQQRIIEIALQIPEYVGYQDKDRRREMNEYVRRQLSRKYDEQRTRLSRLLKQAPLDHVSEIENLDQKLLRLIARFQTAMPGYAGWFDAAQIVESDLERLTQFDQTLAEGVAQLKAQLDAIGDALKSKQGVEDAIAACADTLDALNAQYDQREEFVAFGKKPELSLPKLPWKSPLDALKAKIAPPKELVELASLKVNDAVTYGGTDYVVSGKITYTISAGSFWAFLLADGGSKLWLRVGPGGEIAACREIEMSVPSPQPETLSHRGKNYARGDSGAAQVSVEGAGGVKRGTVNYARYRSSGSARLWIEDFSGESRVMAGQTLDASEITAYRR
jgi:hypothetical protein